jgi:hypothetical protein
MLNDPQQLIAVNKMATAKVRTELIRRAWKTADLAKAIGLAPRTVTNVLCGKRHLSARMAIEDTLEIIAWSSPSEFAARQKTAANKTKGIKT